MRLAGLATYDAAPHVNGRFGWPEAVSQQDRGDGARAFKTAAIGHSTLPTRLTDLLAHLSVPMRV